MITKDDAKKAWQTVMTFSMMHSDKDAISKKDIGLLMQKAIITLNDYFNEVDANDKDKH